jgi:hypothetical protein
MDALAYVYIEDKPGRHATAKLLHPRWSATDRGQYCQAAEFNP